MTTSIHSTGNQIISSSRHEKVMLYDARYIPNKEKKPFILFLHGFKGYKDWGHFNLLADYIAQQGFVFIKLSVSHNGTIPEHPTEFVDLEAFGHNTISTELGDISDMIHHIYSDQFIIPANEINKDLFGLMGHSRGGGMAILTAATEPRVKAVCTLAAISDFNRWRPAELEHWKKEKKIYIDNIRTGQKMPLYYEQVIDFLDHEEEYTIANATKKITSPMLFFHGTKDETLPLDMGKSLESWAQKGELHSIANANHTFGGQEPYPYDQLPQHTHQVLDKAVPFFKKHLR